MAWNRNSIFLLQLLAVIALHQENISYQINNCRGVKLKFQNSWTISLDSHCHDVEERILYHISPRSEQMPSTLYHGYYESYGRSGGTERYEYVLPNGTTFQLLRRLTDNGCFWILQKGNTQYFRSLCQYPENYPPEDGWKSLSSQSTPLSKQQEEIVVRKIIVNTPSYLVRRLNLPKYVSQNRQTMETSVLGDDVLDSSSLLSQMLHPAVGGILGEKIHQRYISSDRPIHSLTIDGLFNATLLARALDFVQVPENNWVGPETADFCCAGKYRLSFSHWGVSPWARALQSLVSNDQFISFLEALTGIDDLIPMKVSQEELQWAGSNIIGVKSGGYLLVHNDFNTWNGLHRRINVLLYLNENWKLEWGGNLEIWDHNNTRCLHSIPPLFNRMSIFTVTDDAFHGHPEPLTSPKDIMRYALQIVYYTKDKGPRYSPNNTNKRKRKYANYHGAIFQPDCSNFQLRKFCSENSRDSYELRCECNYRF